MPKKEDEEIRVEKKPFKCCGKEFTKEEFYWHKRKCH